jgi:hypothetical protein
MPTIDVPPDHYVLLCARQYAATMRKLRTAANDDERQCHTRMLHYLIDSGITEAEWERRIRERRLPVDIKDHIENVRSLPEDRVINRDEAELIRQVYSVPPVATMDNLTGKEMLDLADMYEGWAHDVRMDACNIARLLGWADEKRALVAVIGADYEPPAKVPGEPDSLLKFIAKKQAEYLNHAS